MTEYELHTQGACHCIAPAYDGRDPMRNRPLSNGTNTAMTIQRYGLGREYAGNTGSPAITEQADGAYVRYEDHQRMQAACEAHNEMLLGRLKLAEGASVSAQGRGDLVDPYSEWTDYAKRIGLLGDDGIASEPARAQTAWNAFSFAWNRSYRVNIIPQPDEPAVKGSLTVAEPVKAPSDAMVILGAEVLHDALRSLGVDLDADLRGTTLEQGIVESVFSAMMDLATPADGLPQRENNK